MHQTEAEDMEEDIESVGAWMCGLKDRRHQHGCLLSAFETSDVMSSSNLCPPGLTKLLFLSPKDSANSWGMTCPFLRGLVSHENLYNIVSSRIGFFCLYNRLQCPWEGAHRS